jgi:hypothetical protein
MPPPVIYVDPRELRPVHSRRSGADPFKMHRQIARFGSSAAGMPPLEVREAADGVLVVYDGVTRATRLARLSPGTLVPVQVWGRLLRGFKNDPSIGDLLP